MSVADERQTNDPRFNAALDLVRRTGATSFQIRYHDDEEPTIWLAVAIYGNDRFEVDAAAGPLRAVLRLCERLVDGGLCAHCGRPSGLDVDTLTAMPMNKLICWYQFDPELRTFRRSCEGDT